MNDDDSSFAANHQDHGLRRTFHNNRCVEMTSSGGLYLYELLSHDLHNQNYRVVSAFIFILFLVRTAHTCIRISYFWFTYDLYQVGVSVLSDGRATVALFSRETITTVVRGTSRAVSSEAIYTQWVKCPD